MKKILILSLVLGLTVVFLAARPASAHRVHFGIGLGFWGPPVYYAPPPVVYTRPPAVYYPPYDYSSYRDWVPGHREQRWTPYGWQRDWVPGYWRYRY
jgi:hypothetical protein